MKSTKKTFSGWMKEMKKRNKARKKTIDLIDTAIHVSVATKLAEGIQEHLKKKP